MHVVALVCCFYFAQGVAAGGDWVAVVSKPRVLQVFNARDGCVRRVWTVPGPPIALVADRKGDQLALFFHAAAVGGWRLSAFALSSKCCFGTFAGWFWHLERTQKSRSTVRHFLQLQNISSVVNLK